MAGNRMLKRSDRPHIRARRRGALLLLVASMVTVFASVTRMTVGSSRDTHGTRQVKRFSLNNQLAKNSQSALKRIVEKLEGSPTLTPAEYKRFEVIRKRFLYVSKAGSGKRLVALTFDDGPGPYTLRVARELNKLHVPATFFQVGSEMRDFADAAKNVAQNPLFVLGNHTENHRSLPQLSRRDQLDQIVTANQVMRLHGEPKPILFRPPYGAVNQTTFGLLQKQKLLTVFWSVDSEDYQRPGVGKIVQNVVNAVTPGGIVLMHDAGGDRSQTVAAIPRIVKTLRRRGYRFVTVPQLLLQSPPPLKQPRPPAGIG